MEKLDKFKKIKGIEELKKYGLPTIKTIYIFNFNKQKKEVENFIRNKDFLVVRTDREDDPISAPRNLKCPKNRVEKLIKELNLKGYVAILQEPVLLSENKLSGSILILEDYLLIELMKGGPLTWLMRYGKVDEHIKLRKDNLEEVEHFGKKLIKKNDLNSILRQVNSIPSNKAVKFTIGTDWLYFWEIRDEKTAKRLEK